MDYEKKYKEALEWARKVMQGKVGFVLDEVLEKFPELKESEDERIRKWCVNLIKTTCDYDSPTSRKEVDDAIAWLEKQCEPVEINPTEFDTRLQTLIGKFDSLPKEELIGSLSFWLNVIQNNGTYKPAKKQGKQKPAKNIVETWKDMRLEVYQQASGNRHESNCSDDTTKMFSLNDIDEIIEKMSEQKPTWSEEDEEIYRKCICAMRASACGFPEEEKFVEQVDNWFKSIKERVACEVNCTTTKEWSAGDK